MLGREVSRKRAEVRKISPWDNQADPCSVSSKVSVSVTWDTKSDKYRRRAHLRSVSSWKHLLMQLISRAEGKSDEYLVLQRVQRSLRESFFILMNGTLFVLSPVWSVLSESGNYFLMGSFTVSNHMWLCFTQLVQSKIVNQRARFNCLNYLIIRL